MDLSVILFIGVNEKLNSNQYIINAIFFEDRKLYVTAEIT